MNCPHCSALAAEEANFCSDCGMPLVLGAAPEFDRPRLNVQLLSELVARGAGDSVGYGIGNAPGPAFRRFLQVFSRTRDAR
jgi:hypothetical protein